MAVLGAGALAALRGYLWVQDGEYLKAALLAAGTALGLTVAGWGWWRWKQARSRVHDPILIRGEGLPHRLRRRVAGGRRPARRHRAAADQGTVGTGGRRLPPLRPPRRGQVQGQRRQAGPAHGQPAPHGPRPVRQTQRAGGQGGGVPVAPARRRRRDAPGGTLRLPALLPSARECGAAPWWATPPPGPSGRSDSPRTCCAATTSTWPVPAWASPP